MNLAQTQELGSPNFIDELLSDFGAPAGTFDILLPNGRTLTFRRCESYGELQSFKRMAHSFAIEACDPKTNLVWAEMGIIPDDLETRIAAFTVHYYSASPKFTQPDALKLGKAPWLLEWLVKEIDKHQTASVSVRSVREIEKQKKPAGRRSAPKSALRRP